MYISTHCAYLLRNQLLLYCIIAPTCQAFWLLSSAKSNQMICNKETQYECLCYRCLSSSVMQNGSFGSWLTIEFDKCIKLKDGVELKLRSKLAEWINEECAIVIHCDKLVALNSYLDNENVIIGGLKCVKNVNRSFLHLSVIYNTSAQIEKDNLMDSAMLGDIIRTREHILGAILMSNIHSIFLSGFITEEPFLLSNEKVVNAPFWHMIIYASSAFLSSFIVSVVLFCCVVFGFLNWRINWYRIARGKWNNIALTHSYNERLVRQEEVHLYEMKKSMATATRTTEL